jgi:hypothetical protein
MPNVICIVTLVETVAGSKKTLAISVDPEPLDLGNQGEEVVDIDWVLDNSGAPSWTFATKGIDFKGPGVHFSDNHGSAGGKKHGWKRKKRNNKKFVYTINVVDTPDGNTLSWDPRVINN